MPQLVIDVVSDVVCPWCYVGKRRLEAALKGAGETLIRWRPFQLDATIPAAGLDRQAYMRAKFGDGPRLDEVHAQIKAVGEEVGVAFDFEAIRRSPNTLDAHRLIRFATEAGVADAMTERLFADYFEHGRDIGDHAVLNEAALACGLGDVTVRLAGEEGAQEVGEEIAAAQRMGVEGVPLFIFAEKYALSGAQPVEVFEQALAQARG